MQQVNGFDKEPSFKSTRPFASRKPGRKKRKSPREFEGRETDGGAEFDGNKVKAYLRFVTAAIQMPREVSTLFPTLGYLKRSLLSTVNFKDSSLIVELGPGTGAITESIAPRLLPSTRYLGIEVHGGMTDYLRKRFPKLSFIQGSAENVKQYTQELGQADHVVSSLPWTILPEDLQERIMTGVVETLKPGGTFSTYVCLNALVFPNAKNLRSLLYSKFSSVKRGPVVWKNIPPAFVYHCKK